MCLCIYVDMFTYICISVCVCNPQGASPFDASCDNMVLATWVIAARSLSIFASLKHQRITACFLAPKSSGTLQGSRSTRKNCSVLGAPRVSSPSNASLCDLVF